MVIDVLEAYKKWKNAPPWSEDTEFVRLVASGMQHSQDLTKVIDSDMVMDSVSKATGNRVMGLIVSTAWVRYNWMRPSGPAAVEEAATWIKRLIEGRERRKRFVTVLDDLFTRAGFGSQL